MGLHVEGISGQSTLAVTAPSAVLLMDGVQIGAIQNIAATVNYNVQDVDEIGNALTARFVAGVTKVKGQARQAYVEPDIFFNFIPAAVLQEGVEQLTSLFGVSLGTNALTNIAASTLNQYAGQALAKNVTLNSNDTSRIGQLKSFLGSQALQYIQTEVILFDIEIRDGSETDNSVHTLRDCIINSRSIRLTNQEIILMTDLEFMARGFV